MRIFATLRSRLIAMVAALLAVTIGSVTIISTRVAHYEIRKFDVEVHSGRAPRAPSTIGQYYRAHGSWAGVQPVIDQAARSGESDIIVFDAQRRLVGTSNAVLRDARLMPDGGLMIERRSAAGLTRELIRGPQMIVRDANGNIAGSIFIMPRQGKTPEVRPMRAL